LCGGGLVSRLGAQVEHFVSKGGLGETTELKVMTANKEKPKDD